MPNLVNELVVRELTEELKDAEGVLIVSMAGLTVSESARLRDELATEGVRLRMVRNSLARIALRECGHEVEAEVFQGNVAIACGAPEHAIHAAKVVSKSDAKKAGKLAVRGGLLEGKVLGPGDASSLASMPDRDTLRAQMLGVLSGPARSLVGLLAAPGGSLARVLQARVDAGGGAGAGAEGEA